MTAAQSGKKKVRGVRGSYQRRPHVQDYIDRLAQHVGDGGTIPAFAAAESITRSRTHQLWQMLCGDMGPQSV